MSQTMDKKEIQESCRKHETDKVEIGGARRDRGSLSQFRVKIGGARGD